MPDPKLKAAMEEIKVILKKHDIGAVVLLSSPDEMEYLAQLDPTWSCIRFDGEQIRIRCLLQDYPAKDVQKKTLEDSVGMLAGFCDIMNNLQEGFMGILKLVGEK